MTLLELVKAGLTEEDKQIIPFLDLAKTDEEIIRGFISGQFLNFEIKEENNENQEV